MLIPILVAASISVAQSDTLELRREIEQLNRAMESAFNRGDLKGAAAYYADDAIIRTAGGVVARGREQVDAYFTGIAHPKSWKLDVIQVGGTRDHAWQVGRSTLVHGQPERTSIVQFFLVWRRQANGHLKIAVDYYHSAEPRMRGSPQGSADTIRLDIGSPLVDGRVYKPHAARVRVWVGPGEGTMRAEWTNELSVGDSAGKEVHRWVTKGFSVAPAGDTIRWELKQTYDARTLQPYGIARTASNGAATSFRIDGNKVTGTIRNPSGQERQESYEIDRPGYVASASDLVPLAVGLRPGAVILAPVWGPGMRAKSEMRVFTVIGRTDVNVEGSVVNAWKVEERKQADRSLVATWWLLDKSPYMVYGEVPLPDGSIQRMTEVEVRR